MSVVKQFSCDLCGETLQKIGDEYFGVGVLLDGKHGHEGEKLEIIEVRKAAKHFCNVCYSGLMGLFSPKTDENVAVEREGICVPDQQVFTVREVATICRATPRTVSRWFDSGRLGGYKIPGSQDRRITRAHLVEFLKGYDFPLCDPEEDPHVS